MRAVILGLVAVLAVTGVAQARDCSGQGSDGVLTFDSWTISASGKAQVELAYRLDDDKAVTLMQGHVYFQVGVDDVLADAAIAIENVVGVAERGSTAVTLSKAGARRLAQADHASVAVFACTNYTEYLDGSGLIID